MVIPCGSSALHVYSASLGPQYQSPAITFTKWLIEAAEETTTWSHRILKALHNDICPSDSCHLNSSSVADVGSFYFVVYLERTSDLHVPPQFRACFMALCRVSCGGSISAELLCRMDVVIFSRADQDQDMAICMYVFFFGPSILAAQYH